MAAQTAHSNLFVGNLNTETSEEQLKGFFERFGGVESCRVVAKDEKTNGFVKMADVSSAEQAINSLNGQNGLLVKFANFDVGGKQKAWGGIGGKGSKGWGKGWGAYWVPPPKLLPRDDENEKPEGPPSENLYVKHLPVGVTEDQVKETFKSAGEVVEVRLLRPEFSLEWAALVQMASAEAAASARQTVDNTFPAITTEPLSVKVQTKSGAPKEDHCYIKGVPTNTTKEKVEALFGKYGEVKWCNVMPSALRWKVDSSSSALVEMGSAEEVQKAIAGLDEQVVPFAELGSTIKVRYALVKEKKEEADAAAPAS